MPTRLNTWRPERRKSELRCAEDQAWTAAIRLSTSRGRPLASDSFLNKLERHMLNIRKEQMEAFELAAREQFITETVQRLDDEYPDRFGRIGDKKGFVRDGVRTAERHGFSGPIEVLRYIRLMVRIAPDLATRTPYDGYLAQLSWRGSDNTLQWMERAADGK